MRQQHKTGAASTLTGQVPRRQSGEVNPRGGSEATAARVQRSLLEPRPGNCRYGIPTRPCRAKIAAEIARAER